MAVIFGVAYSFAAFFESFAAEFAAQRADVALVFGLSGLIYFVLGAGGGMLADLLGPVLAGAVFDAIGSYGPVIWACIVLSALATLASSRLVGTQRTPY